MGGEQPWGTWLKEAIGMNFIKQEMAMGQAGSFIWMHDISHQNLI